MLWHLKMKYSIRISLGGIYTGLEITFSLIGGSVWLWQFYQSVLISGVSVEKFIYYISITVLFIYLFIHPFIHLLFTYS